MSFASRTKNELVSLVVSDCCAKAELSALTKINGVVNISRDGLRIEFQTQNATIARRYIKLLRQLYDVQIDLLTRKQMRLNKANVYIIRITNFAEMIIEDLMLIDMDNSGIAPALIEQNCCKRAYLRGAFLASGSVNNPERSAYHFELSILDAKLADDLQALTNEYNLNARILKRKRNYIVYIKESEKISDFLRIINATNAVLDFEDIRIFRDMNNSVNRIRNCDIANLNRSWEASNKAIDNINLIADTLGLDILNDKLLEVAILRLKYPDSTFAELSELYYEEYNKQISKSGLNHRLRKINEIAGRLKESQT
jgi:hypothetical protein